MVVSTIVAAKMTSRPQSIQSKKNELEGIVLTAPLHALLLKATDLLPTLDVAAAGYHMEKEDEKKSRDDYADVDHNIRDLLDQMVALSQTTQLPSIEDAVYILKQQQLQISQHQTTEPKLSHISIPTIRAMTTLFNYLDKTNGNSLLSTELERTLEQHSTNLVYTKSLLNDEDNRDDDESMDNVVDQNLTKEQKKFQARMRQLRLQNEERKYMKITNNVHKINMNDDQITTKSMTYAASIGLNMIVAPITFGVFMYFFAGSLLDFFWPTTSSVGHYSDGTVDVKKVIAGVVSGVLMLFIEMILFVIRTHELDKAMLQKKKKQGKITSLSPFGYYKSTTTKTYVDH
jgi:Endoplasmic reticulum-based factor for assembly of V-ATPase